jgi:hypothetical protein
LPSLWGGDSARLRDLDLERAVAMSVENVLIDVEASSLVGLAEFLASINPNFPVPTHEDARLSIDYALCRKFAVSGMLRRMELA